MGNPVNCPTERKWTGWSVVKTIHYNERQRVLSGAIFDKESTICRTAFRYEAEQHNNSTTSRFKLDRYEKDVNVLGNFELSKAGKHCSLSH